MARKEEKREHRKRRRRRAAKRARGLVGGGRRVEGGGWWRSRWRSTRVSGEGVGRRTRNEEILSTFPTLHAASYPLRRRGPAPSLPVALFFSLSSASASSSAHFVPSTA